MEVRLTVSLLDEAGHVVAWAFVRAAPRGDGGLWALEPFTAVVEREAAIVERVVHWADLHVGQRTPWGLAAQEVGMGLTVRFSDALVNFDPPSWPVPCVTVRGDAMTRPGAGRLGVM